MSPIVRKNSLKLCGAIHGFLQTRFLPLLFTSPCTVSSREACGPAFPQCNVSGCFRIVWCSQIGTRQQLDRATDPRFSLVKRLPIQIVGVGRCLASCCKGLLLWSSHHGDVVAQGPWANADDDYRQGEGRACKKFPSAGDDNLTHNECRPCAYSRQLPIV